MNRKYEMFGLQIDATTLKQAVESIVSDIEDSRWSRCEFLAVNNLVYSVKSSSFRETLSSFDYIFPDGMPIYWGIKWMRNAISAERITARDFVDVLCKRAQDEAFPVYFYGCTKRVINTLIQKLSVKYPHLQIVGYEPSKFQPLTNQECSEIFERVNQSGARILFVGMGCPVQEELVSSIENKIEAVQLCVGSAFLVHSGTIVVAPKIMQNIGLEWLYRLLQEPRRLWRRYLFTNSYFLWISLKAAWRRIAT